MSPSEKHWCREATEGVCQQETVMGLGNETREEFKIVDMNGSFSLTKHSLTYNDTGLYRCTVNFQNDTKALIVELRVLEKTDLLLVNSQGVKPKLGERLERLVCQYPQDYQEMEKYWLCDEKECPETMKMMDDRFRSAMELSIANGACSFVHSYQCQAKMQDVIVSSDVFETAIEEVTLNAGDDKKVRVNANAHVKIVCKKQKRHRYYYEYGYGYEGLHRNRFYFEPEWCKVDHPYCYAVTERVLKTRADDGSSLTIQMCVKPIDAGRYRCKVDWYFAYVEIVVTGIYNK